MDWWTVVHYQAWYLPCKFGLAIAVTVLAKQVLKRKYRVVADVERKAAQRGVELVGRDYSLAILTLLSTVTVAALWFKAFAGFGDELARGGLLGTLSILSSLALLALIGVMVEYNLRTSSSPSGSSSQFSSQNHDAAEMMRRRPSQVLSLWRYLIDWLFEGLGRR